MEQTYITNPLNIKDGIDSILISGFSSEMNDKKLKRNNKSESVIIICNPNAISYANMYLGVSIFFIK